MRAETFVRWVAPWLWVAIASCCAADVVPLEEASCELQNPPADAGELAVHGKLMKVFPRISRVGAAFNGCQTLWIDMPSGWEISRLVLRNGRVVQVLDAKLSCTYRDGKLESAAGGECPMTSPELLPSEPAGCVSRIIGTPKPKETCITDEQGLK